MSDGSAFVSLASFVVPPGRDVEALFGTPDDYESDLPSDEVGDVCDCE